MSQYYLDDRGQWRNGNEPLADWEVELLKAGSTPRARVLDDAKQAVCSDRNAEYGEPIDNFTRWAGVCQALGYRGPGGRDLKPHDLAVISTAGKLSRVMQTPGKRDHSVDISGYGSLIYELVTLEDQ